MDLLLVACGVKKVGINTVTYIYIYYQNRQLTARILNEGQPGKLPDSRICVIRTLPTNLSAIRGQKWVGQGTQAGGTRTAYLEKQWLYHYIIKYISFTRNSQKRTRITSFF